VIRWAAQYWNKADFNPSDPGSPKHQTIAIEILEIVENRITKRWITFDASYHMRLRGW
jgi:hypothetical protein